jgi:hypothetical protein
MSAEMGSAARIARVFPRRTVVDHYVVAVAYRTRWEGEVDHYSAEVCADPQAVADYLCGYDPTAYLLGLPPSEHYRERAERMRRELRLRYEAAVSEVLAVLEPERIS